MICAFLPRPRYWPGLNPKRFMSDQRPILLAEDNAQDAELILEAFAEQGCTRKIDVVRDGAEALDYLHRRAQYATRPAADPRVVLLDVKMPRASGLETLHSIKSHALLHTIPVVMFTSSREENDLLRSYELGANAYVVKPVDFAELSIAVRNLGNFWGVSNEPPPRPR